MHQDEFFDLVQLEAHLATSDDAQRITRVVLEALGARLKPANAATLASRLPPALGLHLRPQESSAHNARVALVLCVTGREEVSPAQARRYLHAVIRALVAAVAPETREPLLGAALDRGRARLLPAERWL